MGDGTFSGEGTGAGSDTEAMMALSAAQYEPTLPSAGFARNPIRKAGKEESRKGCYGARTRLLSRGTLRKFRTASPFAAPEASIKGLLAKAS